MHEWIDSELSAILLALIVIIVVSLAFAHHMTSKSNQRLRKIEKLGIDARIFAQRKHQFQEDYKSMLVTDTTCVICQNPTTRRCSRCKSTRYCSPECQVIHWKEGHKSECHAPEAKNEGLINNVDTMCNGKHLETSKKDQPTTLLNPISLGFFKSDITKLNDVNKKSLPAKETKSPSNSLSISGSLPKPKTLLFPYNYFIKLFEWNGLGVPCGLINCGNSCFANVVLQCLTYTRPLTAYLLNGCHSEDCKRNDWCFICELQSHVCKVRHNQNPFSPIRILSRIRNIGNHLGYGRQEDAHEFMRFAIDSMQSICLDEVGGEKAVDHATQETTLIHHIFGGHLQSQVKCMECEHESNCYESMMDLAVEIHGVVESLEDAIAQFTTTEMLDGDNKYKCDRCNAYVKARKRLTVHEAPNILTIALKRFQSGKFGKLNKRVTFPEVLNISPYMSGKDNGELFYKLYAVVVHVDMLNASFFGHYICYVKDSDDIWYKIDDNKVKEVELEKVLTQRAYMLFYSRSEARMAPIVEGEPRQMLTNSISASKINRTSTYMESHRNSIFPPTLGTVSVPTDLSRDYLNKNEPIQLTSCSRNKEIEEATLKNEDDIMVSTSSDVFFEDLSNTSISSANYFPLNHSINHGASDKTYALESLNSKKSLVSDIEEVGSHFDVANNDHDHNIQNAQSSHDHFPPLSIENCLDNDDLNLSPSININHNSSHCDMQDTKNESTTCVVSDELHLPKLQFVREDHSTVQCNLPCTMVESEQRNSSCLLDHVEVEKAKHQHYEDASERLKFASTSFNGNFDNINVYGENTSSVHDIPVSQQNFNVPLDDRSSFPLDLSSASKNHSNRTPPQSSNVLLDLESPCFQKTIDVDTPHLESSKRFYKDEVESIEQAEYLEDDIFVQEPCLQGSTLIEELSSLPSDIEKISSEEKITQNRIEMHEELYNLRQSEDDIPYVLVEPLRSHNDAHLNEDVAQQSMEMFTMELHDTNMEPTFEKALSDAYANDNIETREEKKIDTSIVHTKFKKQVLKPLFFPGFLIKSPKPTLKKSSNIANNNAIRNEEKISRQFYEANEGLLYDKLKESSTINFEVSDDENLNMSNNLDNHITSNGNHGKDKLEFSEKSKGLSKDFGRDQNCVSIFMNQTRRMNLIKQGRNDNCACGSQQKWKKCCGKAIALKGELATKQVKV
ncbi:hypothetical protein M758_5G157300 [Ceratodon purpureus]|nr:hypothetical protein M758_5G157300 [Ceratodon purpureus]